jgi:hypothetical protein
VDKAYYSVPGEYISDRLWVRWDHRLVRVFNFRFELLVAHAKAEPGRFRTAPDHIPKEKVSSVERGTSALLRQVATVGRHTRAWSEAMIAARGIEGVRVLVGIKALTAKHSSKAVEEACRIAHSYGAYRLRTVRKLLGKQALTQQPFEFLQEHPVIRSMSDYSLEVLLPQRKEPCDEREIG